MHIKKLASITILLLAIILNLFACKNNVEQPSTGEPEKQIHAKQEYTYVALDTQCTITVYNTSGSDFGQIAEAATNRYADLFGTGQANHLYRAELENSILKLDADKYAIFKKANEVSQLSEGAFDITVGALTDLWQINTATQPPTDTDIMSAKEKVDYHKLIFDDSLSQIYLSEVGQCLEVGGIAKGYIGQHVADELKKAGYLCGIVDLGGNITVFGKRSDTDVFKVGIRSPLRADGVSSDIVGEISCHDTSVITSGAYERYFDYEGKRYHHIIDPRTGYPAESDLISVTIVSADGVYADAFSTAVFVKGLEGSVDMLNTAIQNGYITGAVLINSRCKVYVMGDISFQLTNSNFSGQF